MTMPLDEETFGNEYMSLHRDKALHDVPFDEVRRRFRSFRRRLVRRFAGDRESQLEVKRRVSESLMLWHFYRQQSRKACRRAFLACVRLGFRTWIGECL